MAPHKFSELRLKMSPASQARAKARTDQILQDMRLADLRRARDLTQDQLARELRVNQAWISKIERQADMYLSTLRAYVNAIGGELDLVARFPDVSVRIGAVTDLYASDIAAHEAAATAQETSPPVTVAVYRPSQQAAPAVAEVWRPRPGNTAPRSRTPESNTSSATSRAA